MINHMSKITIHVVYSAFKKKKIYQMKLNFIVFKTTSQEK